MRGHLYVDGVKVAEGESPGTAKSINVLEPYYVGGLTEEKRGKAMTNLNDMTDSFKGCLRNMALNGQDFGLPSNNFFTQPCSANAELGSFFYSDGGYIKLKDNFVVGLDLEISVEIKPRTMSGVILSVVSDRGDYLVLQLENGKISFRVDNGQEEIHSVYTPPGKNDLCNGLWHTITAIKAKNVVTLTVDDVYTYPGIGKPGVSSTDTNDPLYIGGVPATHTGIKTTEQYVGCIRNLQLDQVLQNLETGDTYGHVNKNACPSA